MSDCKNWRHDEGRTSYSKDESPRLPFKLLWKTRLSGQHFACPPLIRVGRRLFFADGAYGDDHATLYCLDAETGAYLWTAVSPAAGTAGLVGSSEDSVLWGTWLGLFGLHPEDGSIKWHNRELGCGGAVCGKQTILACNKDQETSFVVAANNDTGAIEWQCASPAYILDNLCVMGETIFGIEMPKSWAYVPHTECRVAAISRQTSRLLWSTDIWELERSVYGPPGSLGQAWVRALMAADGKVFVNQGSRLWCLDASTGSCLWSYAQGASYAYAKGRLYLTRRPPLPEPDNFICLDATNGKELYVVPHRARPESWTNDMGTIAGDYFFFTDQFVLFALRLEDGKEAWMKRHARSHKTALGLCIIFSGGKLYSSGPGAEPGHYIYCFGPAK